MAVGGAIECGSPIVMFDERGSTLLLEGIGHGRSKGFHRLRHHGEISFGALHVR